MAHASLTLDISSEFAELASDALFECGASGLEEQGTRRKSKLIVYAGTAQELDGIRAALPAALAERGIAEALYRITVRVDEHSSWEHAYFEHLRPVEVAPGYWLRPARDAQALPQDVTLIAYEPALAFGDGGHPTTRLAAEAVVEHVASHPSVTMLDYGSGNGVLALLGVKAGAARAIGLDIDPRSVAAARANAKLNGLESQTSFVSELESEENYGFVVANMERPALLDNASRIAARVQKGGTLAITGFLSEQAEDVLRAFAEHLSLARRVEKEGWALALLTRA